MWDPNLEGSWDVSLETEERVTALVANLPIKRARPTPLEAADSQARILESKGRSGH